MEEEDQEMYDSKENNEPFKDQKDKEKFKEKNDCDIHKIYEKHYKTPLHSKSVISQQEAKTNNYISSDDSQNINQLKMYNEYKAGNYQDNNISNMNNNSNKAIYQNFNPSNLNDNDKKWNHHDNNPLQLKNDDKKGNCHDINPLQLKNDDKKGNCHDNNPLQMKNDDKTENIQSINKLSNKSNNENKDSKILENELGNGVIDFKYSYLMDFFYRNKNSQFDSSKNDVILLTTGSFNPIHRMHIEILNIAYRYLRDKEKYNIICGLISPSADCYVKHKKPPLIPFKKRCEIIECALNEYNEENKDNIPIFLHKWEGTHQYFIDFPDVIKEIQGKLEPYNIRLIYVCGMDLFLNCAHYLEQNVIAVDRKPYKNKKFKNNEKHHIYIIKDEKTEPYSSTFIRDCFLRGDTKSIEKVTFPKTAKKIIDFYNENINKFYKK